MAGTVPGLARPQTGRSPPRTITTPPGTARPILPGAAFPAGDGRPYTGCDPVIWASSAVARSLLSCRHCPITSVEPMPSPTTSAPPPPPHAPASASPAHRVSPARAVKDGSERSGATGFAAALQVADAAAETPAAGAIAGPAHASPAETPPVPPNPAALGPPTAQPAPASETAATAVTAPPPHEPAPAAGPANPHEPATNKAATDADKEPVAPASPEASPPTDPSPAQPVIVLQPPAPQTPSAPEPKPGAVTPGRSVVARPGAADAPVAPGATPGPADQPSGLETQDATGPTSAFLAAPSQLKSSSPGQPSALPDASPGKAAIGPERTAGKRTVPVDERGATTPANGASDTLAPVISPIAAPDPTQATPAPPSQGADHSPALVALTHAGAVAAEPPGAGSVMPSPSASAPATRPAEQVAPVMVSLLSGTGPGEAPRQITVRLDPIELGRVEMQIDRGTDGAATVRLTAERQDTLLLLMRDETQLHRTLDLAGIPAHLRTVEFHLADPPAAPGPAGASGSPMSTAGGEPGAGQEQRSQNGTRPDGDGRPGSPKQLPPGFTAAAAFAQPPRPSSRWYRAGIDLTA